MQNFATHGRSVSFVTYHKKLRDSTSDRPTWPMTDVYGSGESTTDYAVKMMITSGLSLPYERLHGEEIRTEDLVELGEATLYDTELALGTPIDLKFLEDLTQFTRKQYLSDAGAAIRESFVAGESLLAALPFIRAFNSSYLLWDGSAMCASRTLYNGTTYSNTLGTKPVSFSVSWDGHDKLVYGQYSQKGLHKKSSLVAHMVHPSKARYMPKIWQQEYEPDILERNKNTLSGKGVKVVYNVELTSTGDQFFFGPKAKKNLIFHKRKNLTPETVVNPVTRTMSLLAHMRRLFGCLDFEDIVGAQGSS